MERIQTIATAPQFAAEGDSRQNFTVNTAVNDVGINIIPAVSGQLKDVSGRTWLHAKDNISVLSIGFSLPYNFGLSEKMTAMWILYYDSTGAFGVLDTFGDNTGMLWIPSENYELSVGAYVPWPSAAIGSIRLVALIGDTTGFMPARQCRISMIGVPAALNGTTQYLTSWIKLSQNDKFYMLP
jgi:hypothetical protein